ncbi:cupin domain-containing protein [Streptomyces sp. SID13031]|uniref:cupin domain-containing protein n=1 Tax=Streptomyces sp. SID13031 TaxID=2706046 RepID=UPI0013CC555F|nr:cupin domain-containing protein [Streptomyces sp. SID13031]NEA34618.1 cupin domain-containing protein [Streptomyces sp. SID13031]
MSIIRAAEAPQFDLPGVHFTGLAAPSRGSESLCTWKLRLDVGLRNDEPHTLDRDEVFMVLSGTVQLTPDGEKLGAGDAAVVPAREPIQVRNLGETEAELYVAITAGFTGTMADGTTVQPPWAQ